MQMMSQKESEISLTKPATFNSGSPYTFNRGDKTKQDGHPEN